MRPGSAPPPLALDTNVLVRTLVEDDPAQCAAARRFMERCDRDGVRLLLTHVVLCECLRVLGGGYRMKKAEVLPVLDSLRTAALLDFEDREAVEAAMAAWAAGRGDFADYLIRETARRRGCAAVVTFDGKLRREPGFRAP